MSHSHSGNFIHIVFSTKDRLNSIPADLQEKLSGYLFGIGRELRIETLAAGGTQNHVHLLVLLPPTMALSEAVQKLKANSSRWISEHGSAFQWQKGYGAFSVSPSMLETVNRYIRNQAEHHKKKRSFEEEFLAMLQRSGVAFDSDNALG